MRIRHFHMMYFNSANLWHLIVSHPMMLNLLNGTVLILGDQLILIVLRIKP